MTEKQIETISELVASATALPWKVFRVGGGSDGPETVVVDTGSDQWKCIPKGPDTPYDGAFYERCHNDAKFIASAREYIPALIAEIRRLQHLIAS